MIPAHVAALNNCKQAGRGRHNHLMRVTKQPNAVNSISKHEANVPFPMSTEIMRRKEHATRELSFPREFILLTGTTIQVCVYCVTVVSSTTLRSWQATWRCVWKITFSTCLFPDRL
jgi:hypothetical protein